MRDPLDHLDRLVAVGHAGQLNQNLKLPLALDNRFADTHAVDAVPQDLHGANDGIFLLRATGDSLAPLSYIANTSLADGFWHLDGSFVENGIAWLKNGGLLWRIEF